MGRAIVTILCFLSFFHLSQAKEVDMGALDKKEQAAITISAYTANGDMDRLKTALEEGLEAGLATNEIKEIFAHLYAYVGFPRSLNAQTLFMNMIEIRKKQV
jgi:alkylhydroperoxidase/carboxymuconolactone decarboxylase family protein YurZ